jgi:hypothetical protein
MESEFSWLVLVLAFAAVTGGCGLLLVRLRRVSSPGAAPSAPRDQPADRLSQ